MSNLRVFTLLVIICCGFVSACAPGSGEGLDSNGNPVTAGSQSIPLAANFASIQANIFTPNCATSGCHVGTTAPFGLRLDAGNSFTSIFEQTSSEDATATLIVPGDADNSYLVRKIQGNAGSRMPKNLPALSADKIQVMRDWVNNGALGPSLSSIQRNIFSAICVACHSVGAGNSGGLNLEDGQAFSNLVGIQQPPASEIRVVAGAADNSFLVDKLEGNDLGGLRGERMPLSQTPLEQEIIDVIRDWINAGALNN
jgi:hypothetical protein